MVAASKECALRNRVEAQLRECIHTPYLPPSLLDLERSARLLGGVRGEGLSLSECARAAFLARDPVVGCWVGAV